MAERVTGTVRAAAQTRRCSCITPTVSITLLLVTACEKGPVTEPAATADSLVDIAVQSGLVFEHVNGARGDYYYPEIMGSGVAVFDIENDGDLDIYLVQGYALGESEADEVPTNKLFRNELIPTGQLSFTDISRESGTDDRGYGMGAAVADVDNDGLLDLFVSNFGTNRLYRNLGAGRFAEIGAAAGVDDPRWSTSSTFADYDGDGDADLYVGNYETFSVTNNKQCFHKDGRRDYCGPDIYQGSADQLLRNNGDGTFADVTVATGLRADLPALGVAALTGENERSLQFLVANDARPNYLWRLQADGRFADLGVDTALAFNTDGRAEASMGIAIGDYDADGDEDIFLSHLATETNTLYARVDADYYVDVTDRAGLGLVSLPATGFGTAFVDLDNDGWLDLFVANGAVIAEETQLGVSDYPYGQRNQWFVNNGEGRFNAVTGETALRHQEVGRGLAIADIDNDGDSDLVVTNNRGPVELLRNDIGQRYHWVGIDLRAAGTLGELTRVVVKAGDRVLVRRTRRDGSYLSSSDPRLIVGLGERNLPVDIEIHWRHRPVERYTDVAINQYHLFGEASP